MYRALPLHERQRLKEIGAAATGAKKKKLLTGKSSFGKTGQEIEREKVASWHRGLRNQLMACDSKLEEMSAIQSLEGMGAGLAGALAAQKISERARGTAVARELIDDFEQIEKFATNADHNSVAQFDTRELRGHFVPVPSEVGATFELFPCTHEDDAAIANLIGHNALHYGGPQSMQAASDQAWTELNKTLWDAECTMFSSERKNYQRIAARQACACALVLVSS